MLPDFCAMCNPIHLTLCVYPNDYYSDEEVRQRYQAIYCSDMILSGSDIQDYRDKWVTDSKA